MTIQETAGSLASRFIYKEKLDTWAPASYDDAEINRVQKSVYEAVGEFPNDDIHSALLHFADYETEHIENGDALDEVEPLIYNGDLLTWLADSDMHVDYVDNALAEGYNRKSTLIDYVQYANAQWKRDIYSAVLDTLKEIVAESVEEEAEV